MPQNLQQQILSRSDYKRGLLNFIDNNPGCTSDDMFNSGVANAIIPIGIREEAISLWIKQLIREGYIESKNWKLYPTGQSEWEGHNVITKENTMKISKRQLKRIIKEEYSKLKRQGLIRESYFKGKHIELQDELLAMAQERGGAITVNEAYQNDLVMEMGLDIDTTFQILMDMVAGGILIRTHDYQDQYNMGIEMVAFTVHPDYM